MHGRFLCLLGCPLLLGFLLIVLPTKADLTLFCLCFFRQTSNNRSKKIPRERLSNEPFIHSCHSCDYSWQLYYLYVKNIAMKKKELKNCRLGSIQFCQFFCSAWNQNRPQTLYYNDTSWEVAQLSSKQTIKYLENIEKQKLFIETQEEVVWQSWNCIGSPKIREFVFLSARSIG